jgi:hypothetical protein
VIAGAVVSTTVILNVHAEWLPPVSVAVQVTVVVPSAKVFPDGGTHTTVGCGSVSSVAVGVV